MSDSGILSPTAMHVPRDPAKGSLPSATSPDTDVRFDRFIELPQELKVEIFRHCLRFPWSSTSRSHDFVYGTRFLNIALANKELFHIAVHVYYYENTFKLASLPVPWSRQVPATAELAMQRYRRPAPISFRSPPKAFAHLVTKLEIHLDVQGSDPDFLRLFDHGSDPKDSQLAVLAHPRRASFRPGYTPPKDPETTSLSTFLAIQDLDPHLWRNYGGVRAGWGRYFTSLKELRIVFQMSKCLPEDATDPDVMFFERLPQRARLLLQAEDLQVEVEHKHTPCDCRCGRTIERVIIGMAGPPIPAHYKASEL